MAEIIRVEGLGEALAVADALIKGVTDAKGHVHGSDGKFVTKSSPSKVDGGDGERIHANGVTVGHIKQDGKKHVAYHPNGKTKFGAFSSREGALEALERTHVKLARSIMGSPEKLHAIVRDTYLPGVSTSKNTQKRVPIHHLRSMMRDAHRLGAHYANPVKASHKNLTAETEKALAQLHAIAKKHLGEHSWDDEDLDKYHTVGGTDALRAVADAFSEGKKVHGKTEKAVSVDALFDEISKGNTPAPAPVAGLTSANSIVDEMRKSGEAAPSTLSYLAKAPGSFEDMLRRLRKPLIEASACEKKPVMNEDGREDLSATTSDGKYEPKHWLEVLATFPDHAYVRCSDEDKIWKIPYTLDGDDISCGEPELCSLFFATDDERDGDADDKDELDPDDADGLGD